MPCHKGLTGEPCVVIRCHQHVHDAVRTGLVCCAATLRRASARARPRAGAAGELSGEGRRLGWLG